jgi:hypothetical protein
MYWISLSCHSHWINKYSRISSQIRNEIRKHFMVRIWALGILFHENGIGKGRRSPDNTFQHVAAVVNTQITKYLFKSDFPFIVNIYLA